jgi:predicted HTH domain antitoxin
MSAAGHAAVGWETMVKIAFELPEGPLAALHQDTAAFSRELRIAAAVKWYELQMLSQARAAEVAGLSRAEFFDALGRFGVSPFQATADELAAEAASE